MTRRVVPLLPVLGLLVVDPVPFDWHAVKFAALMAGAFVVVACAAYRRALAWTQVSAALWVLVAVRGLALWTSPPSGRALRWWALLVALVLAHHAGAGLATRAWLRRRGATLLGWTGAALGTWAVVQAFAGAPQASASFANRNFAGAGLAMLLPYALASRGRWWLGALVVLGLAATSSRGGFLAGMVALAVLFAYRRRRWRWLVLAAPVVVVAGGLWLGETNTVKVRFAWYRAAWDMGVAHPVAGVGADGFAREYPPVRPLEEHRISGGRLVHAVHDDYLESFAEGGVPGLLAHLLVVAAAAWALRRQGVPLASLAAFAAASLVDLPLRDPSLLALALFGLTLGARRRRVRRGALPFGFAALAAIGLLLPASVAHYRADRLFGRYLSTRDRTLLDRSLALEPRHEEALLERAREDDLERLLAMRPHLANARLRRTRYLPTDEVVPDLRATLTDHDPHHVLTFLRLAELTANDDPLQAISLLERAIRADPRPLRPWVELARLHREGGRLDAAERFLHEAERRARGNDDVARERLELELAALREGRVAPERFAAVVARRPAAEIRLRIRAALGRAQRIEEELPPPRFEPREGESLPDATLRFDREKEAWRRERDRRTALAHVEAELLAEALTMVAPTAEHYRLRGQAERDVRRATQFEALALLLETLAALRDGDAVTAERRFRLALRAYPGLPDEPNVAVIVRRWADGAGEAARLRAASLFAGHAALVGALG